MRSIWSSSPVAGTTGCELVRTAAPGHEGVEIGGPTPMRSPVTVVIFSHTAEGGADFALVRLRDAVRPRA